jgi:hypothetical protein
MKRAISVSGLSINPLPYDDPVLWERNHESISLASSLLGGRRPGPALQNARRTPTIW